MWLLMINPTSGGGKGRVIGERVTRFLNASEMEYSDISGTSFESATSNLRTALDGTNVTGVIIVGGDGLVHLAIQELAGTEIPLLVIPGGTGNDFARALGLPLDAPEQILAGCLNRPPGKIDLGKVNNKYFAAILSTGFDSLVNERANRMRFIRGQIKYTISILLELPFFKPRTYRFSVDSLEFTTKAMLIAIANSPSYGGGMLVAPDARFDDGSFDVVILGPVSKLEFLKVFPKVFTGRHITHPAVKVMRGRAIKVEADAVAYADGERIGELPITAEVASGALRTWAM